MSAEHSGFTSPYPGLRPFEPAEAPLFYGRGAHVVGMLRILRRDHFLAVVGTSGCGKSSLVRAGLVPALDEGFLDGPGRDWRFVLMRPAGAPYASLARTLTQALTPAPGSGEGTGDDLHLCGQTLRRGPRGLLDAISDRLPAEKGRVLLLVDQFEELFRFAFHPRTSEPGPPTEAERAIRHNEALAFVDMMLGTARERDPRVYVALTMRSDFLGECDAFRGLPEAITQSQFLPPRLTREELKDVIERPPRHERFGGTVAPEVTASLIAALGDQPDQLPLIQHALLRLWTLAGGNDPHREDPVRITWQQVEGFLPEGSQTSDALGSSWVAGALAQHLDLIYQSLGAHTDEGSGERVSCRQRIAQRLFCALCRDGGDGRQVRRISSLDEVAAMAGVGRTDVAGVVAEFAGPGRNFLITSAREKAQGDLALDLSHESLIRHWPRLRSWLELETESAARYRHLVESAQFRTLLSGDALQVLSDWFEHFQPKAGWAERYAPGKFETATAFLKNSQAAARAQQDAERDEKKRIERERIAREQAKERELELQRRLVRIQTIALVVVSVVGLAAGVLAFFAWRQWNEAADAKHRAEAAERRAVVDRDAALDSQRKTKAALAEAESAQNRAERAAEEARQERDSSQAARLMAVMGQGTYPTRNEFRALWDLAESSEAVRGLFLEQLLSARGQAQRLEVRFPYLLHAIVGLDPAMRERARKLFTDRGWPLSEHQEINAACAKLGSLLELDETGFNDLVSSNFVAAIEKTTDPDELKSLSVPLGAFLKRLSVPSADRSAAQIAAAMSQVKATPQLRVLGVALASLGDRLPQKETAAAAMQLVTAMKSASTSDPSELVPLAEALGQFKARVPRPQAEAAAALLTAAMKSGTLSIHDVKGLSQALGEFASRLPEQQVLEAVEAVLAVLEHEPPAYASPQLMENLVPLIGSLPQGSVGEPIQRLVFAMKKITEPYELAAAGQALDALGPKLPATQAASAAQLLVTAMHRKGTPYFLATLETALEKLEQHLADDLASTVAVGIAAAAPNAAHPEESRVYRNALHRYLRRFPAGAAAQTAKEGLAGLESKTGTAGGGSPGSVAGRPTPNLTSEEALEAARNHVEAMQKTRDPETLNTLARQLTLLGEKLPQAQAEEAVAQLTSVMRVTTDYSDLARLETSLSDLAGRLSDPFAEKLAGALLPEIRQTARYQDRLGPLSALAGVTRAFSQKRLAELARALIADLLTAAEFAEQQALTETLDRVSRGLSAARQTSLAQDLIRQMQSATDFNQAQSLGRVLEGMSLDLRPETVPAVASELLAAIEGSKEPYRQAEFIQLLAGIGSQLSPELAEKTARLFLTLIEGGSDPLWLRSFESTLAPVCLRTAGPQAEALAADMAALLPSTTNYSKVTALSKALIGTGGQLSEARSEIVAHQIVAVMRTTTTSSELGTLGSVLGRLNGNLPLPEAAEGGAILLRAMKETTDPVEWSSLAVGLGAVSQRLPEGLVDDAAAQILEALKGTTNAGTFDALFRSLMSFGQRLPAVRLQTAAQLLAAAMTDPRPPDQLIPLVSDLTSLDAALPPEAAATIAKRLLNTLLEAPSKPFGSDEGEYWRGLCRWVPPEVGAELAETMVSASRRNADGPRLGLLGFLAAGLGDKFPDGSVETLARKILDGMQAATHPFQCALLAKSMTGLGKRLPAEVAAEVAQTYLQAVLRARAEQRWMGPLSVPYDLMTNVPPERMTALAGQCVLALLSPDTAGDSSLLRNWLDDWQRHLSPAQAAKWTARLVAAMDTTTRFDQLKILGDRLAEFGERLPKEQAAAAARRLIAAMQISPDSQRHEHTVLALAPQMDAATLFSILKSIVCLQEFRGGILAALEEKANDRKFDRNLWKAVDWAGQVQIDLAKLARFPVTTDFRGSLADAPLVVINELMTSSSSSATSQTAPGGDWIELLNRSEQSVDLSGAFLSETETDPRGWSLPAGTTLAPNAYVAIAGDQLKPAQPGNSNRFTLSRTGGTLLLVDRDERTNRILDRLVFPQPRSGFSFGRFPDGTTTLEALQPTPGKENRVLRPAL